jgi:hypothetical protein
MIVGPVWSDGTSQVYVHSLKENHVANLASNNLLLAMLAFIIIRKNVGVTEVLKHVY